MGLASPDTEKPADVPCSVARWRVVHGMTAAVIVFYIAFHVINHVFFLASPETYNAIQHIGATVYRNPVVQPILVLLLLFQTIRSEERRVGKECVSTCRSRWSPYH